MSPLRRQGQGSGIHDLRRENGFQIEFGMTKVEGLRFFATLRMTSIMYSTEANVYFGNLGNRKKS